LALPRATLSGITNDAGLGVAFHISDEERLEHFSFLFHFFIL
jgi:hypothetical protein